jgi:hypothetical protein
MTPNTLSQMGRFIDQQASKGLVYHFNGATAYVRVSHDSDVLVIIELGGFNKFATVTLDGSEYFANNEGAQAYYAKSIALNSLEAHYKRIEQMQALNDLEMAGN